MNILAHTALHQQPSILYLFLVASVGFSLAATTPLSLKVGNVAAHAEFFGNSVRLTLDPSHSVLVKFGAKYGNPSYCISNKAEACLSWGSNAKLTVAKTESGKFKVSVSADHAVEACFDIEGLHLYGGGIKNVYPQEKSNIDNRPYITGDNTRYKMVQAVAERYWYTSGGLNLNIDPEVPLFINQDSKHLCFVANNTFPYEAELPIQLSYETCPSTKNLRDAVKCFFESYEKPIPPEQVIGSPIWSTWVEFKRDVDQEKVIQFYNDIKKNDFKLSVMEVDDAWETCYGSQEFDTKKFPDAKAMVDKIHSEGYLVTLWVHPFVGPGCSSFDPWAPYLVKLPNGSIGLTEWWNGKDAALVNFNDPKTAEWYVQRLKGIQSNYGFDSFKFDAGEAAYIPGMSIDEKLTTAQRPNLYTYNYIQAASNFGTLAEARVGAESHHFKLMQRLQDTNSVWDAEGWGLRSVIMSVLQLSLHGYGAVLPDMIGGNCYNENPSKELFIRWTQLNVFLPIFQFSLAPWKYDKETIEITRKFTEMHYQYKDRILAEFKNTSHPVNNPIWWISPTDKEAQGVDDEFLLGETLLVAPVVQEGAVARDIYLPSGKWRDANTQEVHTGPLWLRNYSAPLDVLPFFEAV